MVGLWFCGKRPGRKITEVQSWCRTEVNIIKILKVSMQKSNEHKIAIILWLLIDLYTELLEKNN